MPSYREHAPHPALGRLVECHWSIRTWVDPVRPVIHRVLPDGCIDILFDLTSSETAPDGRESGADASASPGPRGARAVGTMTRPLPVRRSGEVDLHGVRFRPGGARAFLDTEAHRLTDRAVPLDALWGRMSSELRERLVAADDVGRRVSLVDEALLARLRSGARADTAVLVASELVARRQGAVTVDAMANAAGLGARQLERRFLDGVGIPPKTACRVARLRAAVAMLQGEPEMPLARIALEAGYADQPHFTREFRRLAATTPGAYRRDGAEG